MIGLAGQIKQAVTVEAAPKSVFLEVSLSQIRNRVSVPAVALLGCRVPPIDDLTEHTARLAPAERWHLLVRHELGHSLGLQHTEEQDSVMHYSNSLRELDRSSPELTAGDWRTLRNVLPVQWQRD